MENLEETLHSHSLAVIYFGMSVLIAMVYNAIKIKKPSERIKRIIFYTIIISVALPTLHLIFSTVYLNLISVSKGPVHWHADLEIWACGKELDLADPHGLSNKIGTPILHEHNDKRIHLEGVVVEAVDASLGRFFQKIGGELSATSLKVPTNNGMAYLISGINCDSQSVAELQVFVYTTGVDGFYTQTKLPDPRNYLITPEINVPNGDCIIVELDTPKNKTNKLCRSYQVARQNGKLKGEKTYEY